MSAEKKEVQHSIVLRTGMALAVVILLAIVNMVSSYLTAESAENDAVRINLAGSLRMQSYRIASKFILDRADPGASSRAELNGAIEEFEARLNKAVLSDHIHNSNNQVLEMALSDVEKGWRNIKPQLLAPDVVQLALLGNIDNFVSDIDDLVKKLEMQTESKFRVLRFIQGASLLLTLCLATIMFLNVYKYVVGPLHELVSMAAKLRAGDFSSRLQSKGDDELSLLANTFNDMADSLGDTYRSLEEQVKVKTQHLENAQDALRFLYDTSQRMSAEGNLVDKLERTIDHLQRQIDAECIEFLLSQKSNDHPFIISSHTISKSVGAGDNRHSSPGNGTQTQEYALEHDRRTYGALRITWQGKAQPQREQHQMLTALAETLGAALANESRKHQEHRVVLMEERAAIARDLHDSIAQSLSFTRIQISRFQTLRNKQADTAQLDEVLSEIRTGIQAAYGQLRELLTTFRMHLDSPGLQTSLAETALEFEEKGKFPITLHSTLQNYPLTPNEEIHILQIVREALSNILRHSGADRADIDLDLNNDMIVVRVTDNGSGFVAARSGHTHYGQTIMRERAEVLGGSIEFIDQDGGGAQVLLKFLPEQARAQPSAHTHTSGDSALFAVAKI